MLRQIFFGEDIFARNRHRMLNDIFQFSNIPWIGMIHQLHAAHRWKFLRLFLSWDSANFRRKVMRQRGDVFLPLTQRRHDHLHNIEPIKQIFPETSFFHFLAQVLVGRGNHSYIDFDGFAAAHRGKAFFLEDPQ